MNYINLKGARWYNYGVDTLQGDIIQELKNKGFVVETFGDSYDPYEDKERNLGVKVRW